MDFRDAAFDVLQRAYRSLTRHRERYLKAYCAQYHISPEELDQYELVVSTMWVERCMVTTYHMRRRNK